MSTTLPAEHSALLAPRTAEDVAIRASALTRSFGSETALDGVDLVVPRGVILGVIGPSGGGKTTLIRCLLGVLTPTSGSVEVLGVDPALAGPAQRARLAYMPQSIVLFPNLSVWSNLQFVASLYGVRVRRRRHLRGLLRLVQLYDDRHKRLDECSGGMQRRAALAAALVHEPDLLFLDEPTVGVDPVLRQRFWDRFRALRAAGRTVVVSTQYVGEAAMCDLVAVMARGRIIALARPDELRRSVFAGTDDPDSRSFEDVFLALFRQADHLEPFGMTT